MADIKISGLPGAIFADLGDTDVYESSIGGALSKKVTLALIRQYVLTTAALIVTGADAAALGSAPYPEAGDSAIHQNRMKLVRADGGGPFFSLMAVKGSIGVPAALDATQNVGSIDFRGYTGAAFAQTASIQIVTQTAWSGANADSRMEFRTRPTGGGATVLAMTIGQDGTLAIGGTNAMLGTNSPLQINSTVTAIRLNRYGANTSAVTIAGVKSRNATIGNSTAVAAGDDLFALTMHGIAGDNVTVAQGGAYLVQVPTGGVAAGTVAGRHIWTTTNLAGVNARRMLLSSEGTLVVGDAVLPGTNFTTGIALGTTVGVDPTTTVDLVHIYGHDRSAGNRQFAVHQEAAVAAGAAVASTHKIPVRWNNTDYFLLASNV